MNLAASPCAVTFPTRGGFLGQAYAVESLFAGQSEALEAAMWIALRTLQDKATLNRRMAEHARARSWELV